MYYNIISSDLNIESLMKFDESLLSLMEEDAMAAQEMLRPSAVMLSSKMNVEK